MVAVVAVVAQVMRVFQTILLGLIRLNMLDLVGSLLNRFHRCRHVTINQHVL
jgi:hypothetical protein